MSFCSQRGEGVKKGQKIAVVLIVWPLSILYNVFKLNYGDKKRKTCVLFRWTTPYLLTANVIYMQLNGPQQKMGYCQDLAHLFCNNVYTLLQ